RRPRKIKLRLEWNNGGAPASARRAARSAREKTDGFPSVRALVSIVEVAYAASSAAEKIRGSGTFSSLMSRGMTLRYPSCRITSSTSIHVGYIFLLTFL